MAALVGHRVIAGRRRLRLPGFQPGTAAKPGNPGEDRDRRAWLVGERIAAEPMPAPRAAPGGLVRLQSALPELRSASGFDAVARLPGRLRRDGP